MFQTVAVGSTDLHLPLIQQSSDRRERESANLGNPHKGVDVTWQVHWNCYVLKDVIPVTSPVEIRFAHLP